MSWVQLVAAAEAIRAEAVTREPRLEAAPLAAVGWATVDHERAQQELDGLLAGDAAAALGPWVELERDPALGAAAWGRIAGPVVAGTSARPSLILLEPDTEGRLAAFLARFGEGVAVIYLGQGSARPGEVLRGGRPWGPHVVVLGAPR